MIIEIESKQSKEPVPEKVIQYFKGIMENHYNSGYALVIRCVPEYYKMNIVKLKAGDRLSSEKYGICAIKSSTGEVYKNDGGLCKLHPKPFDKIDL